MWLSAGCRFLVVFFLAFWLAACQQGPAFKATDVSDSKIGGDFKLSDANGRPIQLKDFDGKVTVIFFGYTHCPDVCPTTLGELSLVAKKMGAQFANVQVVFVTADPERDTAPILKQYVKLFHPDFMALRGEGAAYESFKTAYHFVASKHQEPGSSYYSVDHSAGCYVLDKAGKVRLYVPLGFGVENWMHDLQLLLNE